MRAIATAFLAAALFGGVQSSAATTAKPAAHRPKDDFRLPADPAQAFDKAQAALQAGEVARCPGAMPPSIGFT